MNNTKLPTKKTTKNVYYEEETSTSVIDAETGEVKSEEHKSTKKSVLPKEPEFVKLYFDCLAKFKSVPVGSSPILIELLKHASYSSSHDEDGGQILYLNKRLKRDIANKCGVSLTRVEHAITDFVKKEYMYRLDVGTYQFNANFFGKGSWVDIYKLRTIQAEFDFATGEVIANIVRNEEEEMNNATDEIASHSKTEIDKLKGA